MRQIISFTALVLFLVLAFVTYQVGQRFKQDGQIIGWANSLIWEAVGTGPSPIFEDTEVAEGGAAATWSITGRLLHTAADEVLPAGDYVAEIEQICPAANERHCWRLKRLSVDGRLYVTAGIVSLPQPDPEPAEPETAQAEVGPTEGAPSETPTSETPPASPITPAAAAAETADVALPPAAEAADPATKGGLASLSALEGVQRTFESPDEPDDRPLVDQNGRPVPPLPRRNPR